MIGDYHIQFLLCANKPYWETWGGGVSFIFAIVDLFKQED